MFDKQGALIQILVCTSFLVDAVVYVDKGSIHILRCPFKSDIGKVITWYGPPELKKYTIGIRIDPSVPSSDRLNVIGDTENGEYNLQISDIESRDEGQYRCNGESNAMLKNQSFELRVTAPPTSDPVLQQIPNGIVTNGTTITLTCSVMGGKPIASISWQCVGYFDQQNQSTTTDAISSIKLKVSKLENDKMCNCTASHSLWGIAKTTYIRLAVAYAPDGIPTIQAPSGGIIPETSVTLTCTVSGGNPLVTLAWNCTGVKSNNTAGTTASYDVTFAVDKSYNNKVCTCSATHPVSSYRPTVQHTLVVYYAPDVIPKIHAPSGGIISGTSVTLTCTVAGGNPLVTLTWNCTGNKSNTTTGTIASYGVTFAVDKSYNNKVCACSATHLISSYRPTVQHRLVVYYAPDVIPTIQAPSGGIIAGTSATLTCTVSGGNPLVTLAWDCTGINSNNTAGTTASYDVTFVVDKSYNKKVCTCSAKHPVSSYRPTVQHTLVVYYAPDVPPTIQAPSGGIIARTSVTLTCTVSGGNPLVTLAWDCTGVKSNNTAGSIASYDVTFVVDKSYNNKVCTCSATHPVTSYRPTIQHTLVVYYPPENDPMIIQTPSNGTVAGYKTTLVCKVSGGNPLATLSWNCSGNGTKTTAGNTASYSVQLIVSKNDNKRICTCSTQHPDKSYMRFVNRELIVYFGPGRPNVIAEPDMPWFDGNKTQLKCSYDEGNPAAEIQWKRENLVKLAYTESIFDLGQVRKDDYNSSMTCVVFNDHGSFESDALYFNIEYFPQIQLEKQNIFTEEGQNITVSCKSTGNPIPNVTWFSEKNKQMRKSNIEESVLIITDIDREENGNYICRATSISNSYGHLVSVNTTLVVVNYSPDVMVSKSVTDLSENTDLVLTCNASGRPHYYTYGWRHTYEKQYIRTFSSTKRTLILKKLSYEDMGRYECIVNNGISDRKGILNQTNHTTVDVQFAPVFVLFVNVTTGKSGSNVSSTVDFISFPDIFKPVQWRNATQNTVLVNKSNVFITLERRTVQTQLHGVKVLFDKYAYRSSIQFSNFEDNQDGFYNLLVNNSVGMNDVTLRILLSERPKPPTHFSASAIGSTVVTFTWSGGFNGGNSQTFLITYWKINSVVRNIARIPERHDQDYVFDIPKLIPSTTYVFLINATNNEGYSDPVNNTIVLSTKDIPESASSIVGPVGGAVGGIAAAALIAIPIVVVMRKRKASSTKKNDRKNLTYTSKEEDADDGLKDNVLYESAGEDFKANCASSGDVYAIVRKSNGKQNSNEPIQETALYAEVKKNMVQSKKGEVNAHIGTTTKEKATKKKTSKKQQTRENDVYDNVPEQHTSKLQQNKNKDGLVYADLVFKDTGKRRFVIRGIENKTDYADIDLELKADPLPSDESDKEENTALNEEK